LTLTVKFRHERVKLCSWFPRRGDISCKNAMTNGKKYDQSLDWINFFHPEDEGSRFLQDAGTYLPHHRRQRTTL
jgi:hypothetical protein